MQCNTCWIIIWKTSQSVRHSVSKQIHNTKTMVYICSFWKLLNHYLGGSKCADHAADYAMMWRAAFEQNTPLVCLSPSGEIIGLNINFVLTKNDTFFKDIRNIVSTFSVNYTIRNRLSFCFCFDLMQCKSPITRNVLDTMSLLYQNFDVFERYGVDKYLSSIGLSVDSKYRGRGIGRQFMLAR